jgi:hypothetical protein
VRLGWLLDASVGFAAEGSRQSWADASRRALEGPTATPESFAHVYAEGHPQGLRYTAVYADDRCVAVARWRGRPTG